ncbi:hypothetical protein CROQUDRAFT_671617 [Cronartium quercuum f. sp. fusiforme G11]|uniref:Steroid 5-alpha reductase C-terminal domain-containing protein n=1 Tax=Cronartium quercuum f. sp. fusiforme G11 TaxID=708437 RepID=A0A9P6NF51_9BASI|nr:hypothetical protein CROQUDRAFT_671617 [Cronartium quercuum f. sp. fusiforme G11]
MAQSTLHTLLATTGAAYAIQVACASVAIPLQTETFYDLSGSLTFISCTALSLYYPALRARLFYKSSKPFPRITSFHSRQLLMSGFTCIWATRLGTFLYQRIKRSGSDSRFDEIKRDPARFFGAWMAQATWVALTAFPVYAVNSIPASRNAPLGISGIFGATLWMSSFLFEVIADRQKSAWREERNQKIHDEKFITRGLWAYSRHPNYVGEVMMWTSQLILAWGTLPPAMRLIACLSPITEYLLITKLSGLPPLESKADKEWGNDPSYQAYKAKVPVFWPQFW